MSKTGISLLAFVAMIIIPVNAKFPTQNPPLIPETNLYSQRNNNSFSRPVFSFQHSAFGLIKKRSSKTMLNNLSGADNLITGLDSSVVMEDYSFPVVENFQAIEEFFEENLELEQWMLDYEWIKTEKIIEEDLEMEDWMRTPEKWKTSG